MTTSGQLVNDLRTVGVKPGDILFVHSSFKSLGPVEGGAAAVVAALEEAVAPIGSLLMPSFNLIEADKRAATWNINTTPSTVGYLTEFFRRMPGTVRSDHYSHSVAARGLGAEEFVSGHLSQEGMDSPWDLLPWGKPYGTHSPMMKVYEAGGKLLMLGVDYHSSTYMHMVEVMWWNNAKRKNPNAEFRWIDRDKLGAFWDERGIITRGKVGQADCRLIPVRDYVDILLDEVTRNPDTWFKSWG